MSVETPTGTAAWIFVASCIVYTFCYAADLVPWRSIVWFVGLFAIIATVLAALKVV